MVPPSFMTFRQQKVSSSFQNFELLMQVSGVILRLFRPPLLPGARYFIKTFPFFILQYGGFPEKYNMSEGIRSTQLTQSDRQFGRETQKY
jgi:hypothetical protein